MNYTKLKYYSFDMLIEYLNQYKDIPWIFYDIETSGLNPLESISFKKDKYWLNKPNQLTQISATAYLPATEGRWLKNSIDWNSDWKPANLSGIYYKKNYSDIISDDNEFNEKCFLNSNTYSQLTIEKLVANYVFLIDNNNSFDSSLVQRNLLSIIRNIDYQIEVSKDFSEEAKQILLTNKNIFLDKNEMFFDKKIEKNELLSSLTRLTSVILSDTTSSILKLTNYHDDHIPDGSEEETIINFLDYIEDIRETSSSKNILLVGQNNSKFDHKFLDKRMSKYLIKRKKYPEFDMLGISKYFLHKHIIEEVWRTDCNKIYKDLYIYRKNPKNNYLSAKLGDLSKAFNVSLANWHNAIFDVRATKAVFIEMMKFLTHLKRRKNEKYS